MNDSNEAERTINSELTLHVLSCFFSIFLLLFLQSIKYSPTKIIVLLHQSAFVYDQLERASCFLLCLLIVEITDVKLFHYR